ncbi:MAG: hypothetical protein HC835_15355 [Oscillatoriales cyanobacterium RM2_1_1]|nr:hypothetical protein [Oscillatoriales cyanobacterium SM2_3_0]NJO46882.1 hypothetical protein [Oscillatoriales cyanobacterium RM2_1_1]
MITDAKKKFPGLAILTSVLTSVALTIYPGSSLALPLTQCRPAEPLQPLQLAGEAMTTVAGSNCREVNIASLPDAAIAGDYAIPLNDCRRIAADQVAVRDRPNGIVVIRLNQGQNIHIAGQGNNNWVPTKYSVAGFITAANLKRCTP